MLSQSQLTMNQSLVSPSQQLGLVLVTIDTEANAIALAQRLVEARLAACVSYTAMGSVYRWQGELHHDPEWQLVIKTNLTRLEELTHLITQHHPYEVPEVIAVPIAAGLTPYLTWMTEQTRAAPPESLG
jgi:periplasmic divalent cation tolerance protein